MKNRINVITGIIVAFICSFFLASCGKETNQYADYAKVIYHLEDGIYKGSKLDVTMYYHVEENSELKIAQTLDEIGKISPPGEKMELDGWYKTKTDNQFADKVDSTYSIKYKETIDLYAKWRKSYSNKFVYKAKIGNEEVELTSDTNVEPGTNLNLSTSIETEIDNALKERNLTYIKKFEYDSKEYNKNTISEIKMEENIDSDVEKIIYVEYIEGLYYRVENATDFKNAMIYISDYAGIYMMTDVSIKDFSDITSLFKGKELIGNGYTITYSTKNQVKYTDDEGNEYLEVSVFHNADSVNVHDVNFIVEWNGSSRENNVLFTGLALKATNSQFKNINISYTYTSGVKKPVFGKNNDVYDTSNSNNNEIDNVNITYTLK